MREIKFKAWHIPTKKWASRNICLEKEMLWEIDHQVKLLVSWDEKECAEYELVQFTGLYDCEGRQIWEGDILEYEYIDKHKEHFEGVAHVFWDDVNCGFCLKIIKDSHNDLRSRMSLFYANTGSLKLWVIGNRLESPELLEVKE